MQAKSGKAGKPITPLGPEAAEEAADDVAGSLAEYVASVFESSPTELGTSQVALREASEAKEEQEKEELHWVGLKLEDANGEPVADEEYRVKLPDGTVVQGRLDKDGKARIEDVPAGKCEINFPRIHGDEWQSQ